MSIWLRCQSSVEEHIHDFHGILNYFPFHVIVTLVLFFNVVICQMPSGNPSRLCLLVTRHRQSI